jgi:hypothetical protein
VRGAATLIGDSLASLGDTVIRIGEYANLTVSTAGIRFPRADDSEFPRHARLYEILVRPIWYAPGLFQVQIKQLTFQIGLAQRAI